MHLTTEQKKSIFAKYGNAEANTGSAESQIALFTTRINYLTEHLKSNKKDFNTQRALLKLVGQRRKLLDYLKEKDIERYRKLIEALEIRK
jgi:small subunit ribosomal protein S15